MRTMVGRLLRCVWRPGLTLWIVATVFVCAVLQAWVFYSTTFSLSTTGRLFVVFHQGVHSTSLPIPDYLGWVAHLVLACWIGYFGYSPVSPGIGIVVYWLIPIWCSERQGVPQIRTAQSLIAEVPLDFTARILIRVLVLGAPLILVATTAAEFVSLVLRPQWRDPSSFLQFGSGAVIWRVLALLGALQGALIAEIERSWLFGLTRWVVLIAPFLTYRIAYTVSEVHVFRGMAMVILQALIALILLFIARMAGRSLVSGR